MPQISTKQQIFGLKPSKKENSREFHWQLPSNIKEDIMPCLQPLPEIEDRNTSLFIL